MWSRIHLIPLLQAEEDRDLVRRHLSTQAMEKELLGAETKVYNSDRYGFALRRRGVCFTDALQICAADICRHAFERDQVGAEHHVHWRARGRFFV